MAKQSGLGDNFYIAGYDVSGDLASVNVSGGPAALEVTGIDKSAYERTGGLRTGAMSWQAWFNPATDRAHSRFKTLPTADVITTYCRGTTLGNSAAAMVAKQINYDGTRGDDGSFTFQVEAQSNAFGLEWGRLLTAGKRTDTTATNGSSVDFGTGSTTFGLQAYLHVFAFTGTSVTVKLQESSDNGGADAWADVTGGAFTAATGITSQRIATSSTQTVERYLRVVTTGTFSNAVFAVVVNRNDTATSF
ncbi:hypothetical protein H1V43_32120 [Streptomyces sp. PSKA54]|uniref:Uncharacterized protein n=1 Tax=Streptomyces himalayensis subsp. aureolus TaxID=2758039 RepID=A0A7W2D6Y3_9ACTN|nr:hypothetical protein [Streptomyces himalayensis]MBA4865911.1 hypothetical protein [Streptomyces himalayensis subsp. aureolus]